MKHLTAPGIMYDVISYSVIYFNRDSYNNVKTYYSDKSIDTYKYYDIFRQGKRKIDPPDYLYPFFYFSSDPKNHFTNFSLLQSYFLNHYNFLDFNLTNFLDSLKAPSFKQFCMAYYFKNHADQISIDGLAAGNVDDCMQAMLILHKHGDRLRYFYQLIRSFDELLPSLLEYLENCYVRMASFHAQFGQGFFDDVYSYYLKNADDINKAQNLSTEDLQNITCYTIHLIDHLMMFDRMPLNSDTGMFFFGSSSLENVLGWSNYSNLDVLSFCSAFGNEIKKDIIMQLAEKEQTISQLASALFTSRSTINRYVVSLYENLVIQISKKIGTETYYSLNPKYFVIVKKKVEDMLDQIIRKTT